MNMGKALDGDDSFLSYRWKSVYSIFVKGMAVKRKSKHNANRQVNVSKSWRRTNKYDYDEFERLSPIMLAAAAVVDRR